MNVIRDFLKALGVGLHEARDEFKRRRRQRRFTAGIHIPF